MLSIRSVKPPVIKQLFVLLKSKTGFVTMWWVTGQRVSLSLSSLQQMDLIGFQYFCKRLSIELCKTRDCKCWLHNFLMNRAGKSRLLRFSSFKTLATGTIYLYLFRCYDGTNITYENFTVMKNHPPPPPIRDLEERTTQLKMKKLLTPGFSFYFSYIKWKLTSANFLTS